MKILYTHIMSCPICGVHLNWLPQVEGDQQRIIEHPKLVGLEYCEYFGKKFYAPTIELVEEVKKDA